MTASTALTRIATTADGGRLLRTALRIDAAASGGLGLVSLAGAPLLAGPVGAPEAALRGVGGFLVVFGIALVVLSTRPTMPVPLVWAVVVGNLAWVAASAVVALLAPLTVLGTVVAAVQAVGVAVFADLEWLGLRRMRA